MTSTKTTKKDHMETVEAERVKLPILNPENAWLDNINGAKDISEKIKKILYLPTIANAAAVYAHDNNLCCDEKDLLILLFRKEADNALEIIYDQIQMAVGNSPPDRIGYLKDFENWQDRLIKLLIKAFDCSMNMKTWNHRLEALTPDNETLFFKNRQEWEGRLREHLQLKSSVFNEFAYHKKFSDFTMEALKLLQRGSSMLDITRERPEWIYIALKKLGKLPENIDSSNGKTSQEKRSGSKGTQNIHIQNFQEFIGDVRAENVQTGDKNLIHKQTETEKKKKGIFRNLWFIISAIVVFLGTLIGIFSNLGWLEPIKTFVSKLFIQK